MMHRSTGDGYIEEVWTLPDIVIASGNNSLPVAFFLPL